MTASLSQRTSMPFALAESIVPYLDEDRGLPFLSRTMLSAFFQAMEIIGRSENYDHPLIKEIVIHIALRHPRYNAYRELLEKSGLTSQEIDSKVCNIFRYYLLNGGVPLKFDGDLGNPTQEIRAFQLAYSNKKELLVQDLRDVKRECYSFSDFLLRTDQELHSLRDFFSKDGEFLLSLADFRDDFINRNLGDLNKKFFKEALKNSTNRNFVLAIVKKQGLVLEYMNKSFKNDKEVVLAAVSQNVRSLMYASPELRADKEVVLAAVSENVGSLMYASPELRADKEVVLAAVRNGGCALKFASPELRADKEVVLAAVRDDGLALEFASPELRGDEEVVLAAKSQNLLARNYAIDPLQDELPGKLQKTPLQPEEERLKLARAVCQLFDGVFRILNFFKN